MKALTLTQPWATLAAKGKKKIETRSWSTTHRGEMAIHAAKGFPRWAKDLVFTDPFYRVLETVYLNDPVLSSLVAVRGMVLSKCNLVDVVKIETVVEVTSFESPCFLVNGVFNISPEELAFGDYTPDRFMWFMQDMQEYPEPIPAKGALSLWQWSPPS